MSEKTKKETNLTYKLSFYEIDPPENQTGIPKGFKPVIAYSNGFCVVVPIKDFPDERPDDPEDDLHNCDIEGCGTLSHVFQMNIFQKYRWLSMDNRNTAHHSCKKCFSGNYSVRYHSGIDPTKKPHCCGRSDVNKKFEEHLHYYCRTCKYDWVEEISNGSTVSAVAGNVSGGGEKGKLAILDEKKTRKRRGKG